MVSPRFYKSFPEYSSKLEDTDRIGRFDLTLDADILIHNLEREIEVANHSIEFYESDVGFIGKDDYNKDRRIDLESASKKFEQKAAIIRQGYTCGEYDYADNLYAKFLEAAETLREAARVRLEYEERIIARERAKEQEQVHVTQTSGRGIFSGVSRGLSKIFRWGKKRSA